jgi:Raf kinase inhibitor-like YbhB/YbcL family protein
MGFRGLFSIGLGVFIGLALSNAYGGDAMDLTSSAFKDQGRIPVQYVMPGAGGRNLSIPLTWKNASDGTRSFALSIVDPHPVARNWVHWFVINIPKEISSLEEGASGKKMPPGAVELRNSFGSAGYGGPQPPRGTGDHPYVVTLYALSVEKIDLVAATPLPAFQNALEGKVLGSAKITGFFSQ